MLTTFEEVERTIRSHADEWLEYPLYALAFFGSRVRGSADLDSDWDVVAFVRDAPPDHEERHVLRDLKFDLLEISWTKTAQPEWLSREICAMLMSERGGIWVPPAERPDWKPDWGAIIDKKRSFVEHNSRRVVEMLAVGSFTEGMKRYMPRLRRLAQRVVWMTEYHDIPSRPELDRAWSETSYHNRYALLRRAGVHSELIYRLVPY